MQAVITRSTDYLRSNIQKFSLQQSLKETENLSLLDMKT